MVGLCDNLLVGDSDGYLKVWDIQLYCLDEQQSSEIRNAPNFKIETIARYDQFSFVREDRQKRKASRRLR